MLATTRTALYRLLALVILIAGAGSGRALGQGGSVNPNEFCHGYCDNKCADQGGCNIYWPVYDGTTGKWTGICQYFCNT